jgi:hypothetical protein
MGFAAPDQETEAAAAAAEEVSRSLVGASAAGSSAAAAAALGAPGDVCVRSGGEHGGPPTQSLSDDEGLEGLAAALMEAAVDESARPAAANAGQQ